jgi:hypothetical protein
MPLPAIDAGEPDRTLQFLENATRRDTLHRIERMSMWERCRLYVLYNRQWLQPDHAWGDTTRTPFWKPMQAQPQRFFPCPVQNMLIEPIENEWSRLLGSGFQSEVQATDAEPRKQRAAELGNSVLKSKLNDLRWGAIEQEGVFQSVLLGTWVLKTGLETDFTVTTRMPVTDGVTCTSAGCSFKLASRAVPPARSAELFGSLKTRDRVNWSALPVESPNPLADVAPMRGSIRTCLQCDTPHELAPFLPDKDEAADARDYFGRPLGMDIPQCDVFAQNISCYDYFPENDGMVSAQLIREHAEERIVPVEYVRDRYANGRYVEPENVQAVLRWHPIVSSTHGWEDPTAWDHHVVMRSFAAEPTVVWTKDSIEKFKDTGEVTIDRGRAVVSAGRHIMIDDHLQVESQENPGTYLPRYEYHIMPWSQREGEIFGLSATELGISGQDSANTLLSQVQYARHVWGNPKLLAPEGSQIYQAGYEDSGSASDILYYQADIAAAKPEVMQGSQISANWMEELEQYKEGIAKAIGSHEIEVGGAMPGVTAASAMMLQARQAGTRRQPRTERYALEKGKAFTHMLQWMHEAYREPRYYRLEGVAKKLQIRSFKGADLMGQVDVKVTVRPAHDTPEFRQQSIVDMLDKQILVPTSAGDKKRIAKEMGASLDIVQADSNRQVQKAEDEWVAYQLEGKAPTCRIRGDDNLIHQQQHLLDWISDDAEERKDACGWYEAEMALDGWREKFDGILAIEERLKLMPPDAGPQPPMASPVTGEVSAQSMMASVTTWEHDLKAQAVISKKPQTLELKIYDFMSGIVKKALSPQTQGAPPGMLPELEDPRMVEVLGLLRFLAHIECHIKRMEMEQLAATMGAPIPAAPEGAQDAQGLVPASPAEAIPAAGTGPGPTTAGPAGPV